MSYCFDYFYPDLWKGDFQINATTKCSITQVTSRIPAGGDPHLLPIASLQISTKI